MDHASAQSLHRDEMVCDGDGMDGIGHVVGVATEIEIEAAEARVIAPGDRRGRGAASFQLEAGDVP